MAFETTITDGIAHLVLCKPPVNAFNSEEWAGIAAEIRSLGEQSSVRVIVVSAEGKGFCAGVDIKELGAEPAKIVPVNKGNFDTFEAIHRNPKPVVLAIHGFVLGGGIGMAGAADILVASECATFGVPEVDRGAMGGGAHLQ
ncbi:MAG: enoyl-CoA hydratase-related protein, partial [Halieaceae bacterium]